MKQMTFTEVREHFSETFDVVLRDREEVSVNRSDRGSVVLLPHDYYASVKETLAVKQNPENTQRVTAAVARLRQQKGTEHELIGE